MGIIKGFTKTIVDPTDEAKSITIKMLSYFELEDARAKGLEKMRDKIKLLSEFRSVMPAGPSPAREAAAGVAVVQGGEDDSLSGYDVETLLRLGVTAWTYDAVLDITLFDDATATSVARDILRYSKPGAAELGKASSSSTAT